MARSLCCCARTEGDMAAFDSALFFDKAFQCISCFNDFLLSCPLSSKCVENAMGWKWKGMEGLRGMDPRRALRLLPCSEK
jgi:hypothetical protein